MNTVYCKKCFKIYKLEGGNGFIVHNTNKTFSKGHTHITNFNTAKLVLNLAFHKSQPKKRLNNYLLESIIRISNDKRYINNIEKLKRIEA